MDKRRIIRSAGLVSSLVLTSRVFGLLRDAVMAAFFGSSMAMDAFVVAFTVPNLFRNLFGEGALSAAYVPVFSEALEKQERAEVWYFAQRMLTLLSVVLASLVLLGILGAHLCKLCMPLAPRVDLILHLLQVMLPYMFFICLAAFFSSMINAMRNFALPAATPVVLNLIMIAALTLICPLFSPEGRARILVAAWSVVAGGMVQMGMQIPWLTRRGFRLRLVFNFSDPRVRRVVQLMGIAIIGAGMTQLSVVLDRLVAVFFGEGNASYIYYAERLIYLPLGLFATALSTVLLPAFSGFVARQEAEQIKKSLQHALRMMLFIMLPAAAGLWTLAQPIVEIIYQRGNFSVETAVMTVWAVRCYAPGLVIFSLVKILIPVFYAHQDMKTPVRVGAVCTGLNMVLKAALLGVWLVWPFAMAFMGIIAATVLSSGVAAVALGTLAQRRLGNCGWRLIGLAAAKMLVATCIMAGVALSVWRGMASATWLSGWPATIKPLLIMGVALAAGMLSYLMAAVILRCAELREFMDALRSRGAARL